MKREVLYKRIFILLLWLAACAINSHAQDQMTNNGNLRLHPGTTMTIYGNMANNGTFSDAGQMVALQGTTAQNISGTAVMNFNNLKVDNTVGVNLQQHMDITNSIQLAVGALNLNNYTLTVNNYATGAISRTSGYIVSEQTDNSGRLKWWINSESGAHIFPFGTTAGIYIPFVLELKSGNIGYVTVSTYHTAGNNMPYPVTPTAVTHVNNAAGADNSNNVVDRFWQVDKTGASATATLTFTATPAEVGTITSLKAQRWNSALAGWDAPLPWQTNTGIAVTVPGVSNFSPWSLSGNNSPLPIELLSFDAFAVNNKTVDLKWSTATESNNDYFTIERSMDGLNYETVMQVNAAGNSNTTTAYAATDTEPYTGTSYYRLKQTDVDGAYTYAEVRAVTIDKQGEINLSVFPNPSDGLMLNVGLLAGDEQQAELNVYNALGHKCYSQLLPAEEGYHTYAITLPHDLGPGVYAVTVTLGKTTDSKKWIVN